MTLLGIGDLSHEEESLSNPYDVSQSHAYLDTGHIYEEGAEIEREFDSIEEMWEEIYSLCTRCASQ